MLRVIWALLLQKISCGMLRAHFFTGIIEGFAFEKGVSICPI